jgi:trehalose synthase
MSMQEILIEPVSMDQFTDLLVPARIQRFSESATEARELTRDRVVWNISATAHGGGVAEMLQTLLAFVRGVHVDTRWLVLTGGPEFFRITKRIHNMLHGEPGDGGPLGPEEHAALAAALAADLEELTRQVSAGDIVVLHDPQTAGLVEGMRARGANVVWRCHVGRDTPNAVSDNAWAFLRPLLEAADAFVFSRDGYAPSWCRTEGLRIITPSIDPFSAKNCMLSDAEIRTALVCSGIVEGEAESTTQTFIRRGGGTGELRRHEALLDGAPIPATARLVVQVSRWDDLKDMAGVLQGFVQALPAMPSDVHLLLVGPDVAGVSDDPEGAAVLARCHARWAELSAAQQGRVHLACLPMDDVDENAHLVNALQRRASVVVQKSLEEGFGLTVTEAMWKSRAVVASAVGGISDQIVDEEDGLLLRDPSNLAALGVALERLLADPDLSERLGAAAHATVLERFLGDRHLEAYVELLQWLLR